MRAPEPVHRSSPAHAVRERRSHAGYLVGTPRPVPGWKNRSPWLPPPLRCPCPVRRCRCGCRHCSSCAAPWRCVARLLQALGGCAGMVLARAIAGLVGQLGLWIAGREPPRAW